MTVANRGSITVWTSTKTTAQANHTLTLKAPTHIVLTKACYVAMPVKGNREVEVYYVPGRTNICVTRLNT